MRKTIIRRFLPALAAVATVCACGSATTATTATATSAGAVATGTGPVSPGWRITVTDPAMTVGGLWAGGPHDAWLAGDSYPTTCEDDAPCDGTLIVRHWDGTAWRPVAAPKAYVRTPLDQGVSAVAATSAGSLWVFAGRGKESVDYTDALHRSGTGWTRPVRMDAAIESAVAPSPGQVWAFGQPTTTSQRGYYAHFDGKAWTTGGFPIDGTAAAALGPDDVWVGGEAASGALVIDHWNGRSWQAKTLVAPCSSPAALTWVTGVAAVSPHDVWASILTSQGASQEPLSFLEHWNGTSWRRVSLPFRGNPGLDTPLAPDGHGGVWAGLSIGTGQDLTVWFAHYAGGVWSKTAVPVSKGQDPLDQMTVDQLSWIPGTRSLWAAGIVNLGSAVLKYGP